MLPVVTWLSLTINTQKAMLVVWMENWNQSRIVFNNATKLEKKAKPGLKFLE